MSVHYKFKSAPDRYTVIFDGLHISVADLKKEIMKQRKLGKSADLDLQITNPQTREVYDSDSSLIPKNTSVEVARVPVAGAKKTRERIDANASKGANSPGHIELEKITKSSNISTSYSTEDEKIKAMMSQSTQDYDPSKYTKNRGPVGPLPANYTCYRCGNPGHYIKQCPTNNTDVKRSTGIPRSFMIPANADQKGALLTASGDYAVPIIDHQAYKEVKKEKPPFVPTLETEKQEVVPEIPTDLICLLCGDLLQDAVLIPCCGNSFCDECIRNRLLESETHECPECHEHNVSPDSLIPNRFLRTSVNKFKNETGYSGGKNRSVPLNNAVAKAIVELKSEVKPNDIKVNDMVNSPVDSKPVDTELKSEASPVPSEPIAESPLPNDSTDVTMDEVLLDSAKGLSQKSADSSAVNGQTPGLSEELIGSRTPEMTGINDETNAVQSELTTGADNQGFDEAIEGYEAIDQNTVPIEGNPVMSLAQYPAQPMLQNIPGYPRPPRMIGPIRPIRTTMGQQPNQGMVGRPPTAMMQHPRAGVYPRTGMPAGFRPMTDPRGYPMGMTHTMAPYGYPPQIRPNAYHDPYGYMGPRHMGAGAMHHSMNMANIGEAPPPGSAPIMSTDSLYQYTKAEYDDYENRFNRFTQQLESRSRGRPKRMRSISRSRSRSRSRSPNNRSSRTRSSSTSSSTSSSSSSSSFSFGSRSRSYSPRRRSRFRSHYRSRRSPSPRYRDHDRDNRYRRSRSPVRDSRRRRDRSRERYEKERDAKYRDTHNSRNDRNEASHRSSHRSNDKKKDSKQTHSKSSSKCLDKSKTNDKSKHLTKTESKEDKKDKLDSKVDNDSKSMSKIEPKEERKERSDSKIDNDSKNLTKNELKDEKKERLDSKLDNDSKNSTKTEPKDERKERLDSKADNDSKSLVKTEPKDEKKERLDSKIDNDSRNESRKTKRSDDRPESGSKSKSDRDKNDENSDKNKKKSKDRSKKHHKHHHKHHKHRKSSGKNQTMSSVVLSQTKD